jgi:proline- and glutamine-rich splicing factor
MYEQMDSIDGFPEKAINKKSSDFHRARETGPRFASIGSFEHDYGSRWKQLYELYSQKETSLKQELQLEEDKLEAQMQLAKFESETEMLREQLRMREMDRERQKREWEERERAADEARLRNEQLMRRQEDDMQSRMLNHDEDVRRRQQENTLFMQASQLTNLLDQQEQVMQSYGEETPTGASDYDNMGPDGLPMDPKSFMNQYERGGNRGYDRDRQPWHRNDSRARDDFQNKRRRF